MSKKSSRTALMTGQYVPDNDPSRRAWPAHGSILFSSGAESASGPVFFSVEIGQTLIKKAVDQRYIDADNASVLNEAITKAGLVEKITQSDRFFAAFPKQVEPYERLMGFAPAEPGSGEDRIELCNGVCGKRHCKRYPKHTFAYVRGLTAPVSSAMFSQGWLNETLDAMVEEGIITDEQKETYRKASQQLGLPTEIQRADRLIYTDPEYLDIVLGIREEQQAKSARFELCEGPPVKCGRFYATGRTLPITGLILTKEEGQTAIEYAYTSGYYTTEEKAAVENQFKLAGLASKLSGEAFELAPGIVFIRRS